jgi:hypothetical protein
VFLVLGDDLSPLQERSASGRESLRQLNVCVILRVLAVLLATVLVSAGCALPKFLPFRADQSQPSQTNAVWLEADPTITSTAAFTPNTHPFQMNSSELTTLLRGIRVRSSRGLLKGLSPSEQAFSEEEVRFLSPLLSQALERASRWERVVFKLKYAQSRADTSGSLFVRGPYLHFVLADHRVFNREDPEGAATREHQIFFDREEYLAPNGAHAQPKWSESDRTHLSIDYQRLRGDARLATNVQEFVVQPTHVQQTAVPMFQTQMQELTHSNLDLREKIKTLQQELAESQQQVKSLSLELDEAKQVLIEKNAALMQLREQRKPSKERQAPGVLAPGAQRR